MPDEKSISLQSNIPGRVRRLPKPLNAEQALQPLFEAVINSIHAVTDRYGDDNFLKGKIHVEVSFDPEHPENFHAAVVDNGIGLNEKNWEAFCRPDTEHKIRRGGKGVGRLLWLSSYAEMKVQSRFESDEGTHVRRFSFVLDDSSQIRDYAIEKNDGDAGTKITFDNLLDEYAAKFPRRKETVVNHFSSHFVAILVNDNACKIKLNFNGDDVDLNEHFSSLTHESDLKEISVTIGDETEELTLGLLVCDKSVSSGPHKNLLHFIANDRTVRSKPVDDMLGFHTFGDENNLVFHGYVKGSLLDKSVNQERTGFIFPDDILNKITRSAIKEAEEFLKEPMDAFRKEQENAVVSVFKKYPSLKVFDVPTVVQKLPTGSSREEDVVKTLSIERWRFDNDLSKRIDAILSGDKFAPTKLVEEIEKTTDSVQENERRSLAEYVVRRHTLLTFMEKMLRAMRSEDGKVKYQREDLLHKFICPMRVDGSNIAPDDHDLWIIDESLAFSEFFASDLEFNKFMTDTESEERPDLIFSFESCLGLVGETPDTRSHVVLIELKKPGRDSYKPGDSPHDQVYRYINRIKEGKEFDVNGRPIRVSDTTVYSCFIIADILGPFSQVVDGNYQRTYDGKSYVHEFQGSFKGFIKLIEWDDVVDVARQKNEAFFRRLGISA